ncbi:MAG: cation:proton antiporter [Spirochaetales bacterium]|nr:cation:proton antiporter [Spirochaetales bacterium]MCF7938417.1 cation:proton antiporter [Spirochaetales bacterium]
MTLLVFQLSVIIFAAHFGSFGIRKLGMPAVLGEVIAGMIIGPHLLGSITFPGFEHGLFPLAETSVGVSPELYGFAVLASIILLFVSGLETDLNLFMRYAFKGSIIGLGGIVLPFVLGDMVGMLFMNTGFMDPRALFLGVIGVATSVGITARILSENKRVDSPEGVTILSAAVIDDVVGIIVLAVVIGIVQVTDQGASSLPWGRIGFIAARAFLVWMGFTVAGLLLARKISGFLKLFRNATTYTVLSLGFAVLLAGIFEKAGLAMIIGAYVMGLSLSKTDLSYVIQENIKPVQKLFVPLFFAVMGMMVDIRILISPPILIFGAVYAGASVIGKLAGTGLPALFMNFNGMGALRIGMGMIPRGEVALIIAGIGVSVGVVDSNLMGVVIMMMLVTILISPPVLNAILRHPSRGTRTEEKGSETVTTSFDFPSPELTEFVTGKIIQAFENEGFFINLIEMERRVYQIRKDEVSLSLSCHEERIDFESDKKDVTFIKNIVYESMLNLHEAVNKLKDMAKPEALGRQLMEGEARKQQQLMKAMNPDAIKIGLEGKTKEEIIEELLDLIVENGEVKDKESCYKAIWERENSMSTGMQHGIALPHGKSSGVDRMQVAVGTKPEGADFNSLDGEPSMIFILVLSPADASGPHIQFLASVSGLLKNEESRKAVLKAKTPRELYELFRGV